MKLEWTYLEKDEGGIQVEIWAGRLDGEVGGVNWREGFDAY